MFVNYIGMYLIDNGSQLVFINRLGKIIPYTLPYSSLRIFEIRVPAYNNYFAVKTLGTSSFYDIYTVHLRHSDINKNKAGI